MVQGSRVRGQIAACLALPTINKQLISGSALFTRVVDPGCDGPNPSLEKITDPDQTPKVTDPNPTSPVHKKKTRLRVRLEKSISESELKSLNLNSGLKGV